MPAPPVIFPYNPYQQPSAGGMAPHNGGMQPLPQGFPQTPIYYPPPPRQPLLKPETKHFIGKLFLTLLIMGTLFAVVIIAIMAIGDVWSRKEAQRQDAVIISQLQAIPENEAVDKKIEEGERLVAKLKSPINKTEQSQRLAVFYEELGQQLMSRQDWSRADGAFQRSVELDPANHKLISNLAALYSARAKAERDLANRQDLYLLAANKWNDAAEAAGTDDRYRQLYYEAEGKEYFDLAYELATAGQYEPAKNYLKEADGYVQDGSGLKRDIEKLLDWINSRS
jgi:tetratricopeptide (TPR) repeat protein